MGKDDPAVRVKISPETMIRLGAADKGVRVGDLIRKVTDALGIEPCDGCEKRRIALNKLVIRM
jgi:hypothetical protein